MQTSPINSERHLNSVLGSTRHRLPRESFRLHRGRVEPVVASPVAEASPMHSVQTVAATMFVMSVAAGWIAVASLATAPLIGAGELLGWAVRTSGK